MDGLECSEIMLSELERTHRIDAEFYSKINIHLAEILLKKKTLLVTECFNVSDGNHMSISEHFSENQIPYYRGGDIYNFFIEQTPMPLTIPEKVYNMPMLKRSHLQKGDILISIVGAIIGNIAMVSSEQKSTCSCKLAILRSKGIIPEYVAIYLKSKFGQSQIQKFRRGAGQTGLILEDFGQIQICLLSNDFQLLIKERVNKVYKMFQCSLEQYAQAEQMLLNELAMGDFTPSLEKVATKSFTESFGTSGRLDAEYYQTKYDTLFAKLSAVKTYLLGDLVWIKKSVEPGSNEYLSVGIPFVRVSDLSKYGLSDPEIHLNRIPFAHMNLQPKKDTILLSKDGSVGIAYKVEKDSDIVTSGAILHLVLKTDQFLPDYLTLVLNSLIVKMQAERDAGGSIIQHWKPSEIEKVVIPWLPIDKQEQISYKIQDSFSLRRESKELLEKAKQAVEMAIEKDEKTAMNWLSNL